MAIQAIGVLGGVIDPDYRGEVSVILFNHGKVPYTVMPGDRIAQLILEKVAIIPVEEVAHLSATDRGTGGFGSTGR